MNMFNSKYTYKLLKNQITFIMRFKFEYLDILLISRYGFKYLFT